MRRMKKGERTKKNENTALLFEKGVMNKKRVKENKKEK
jgi:hypothetical protein